MSDEARPTEPGAEFLPTNVSDAVALLSILEAMAETPQSFDLVTIAHWANKAKCTIEALQAEVLGLKTLREAEHVLMDAAEADNERLQATIKELQAELALLETNAIAQMEGYKRRIDALKAENGNRS